MTGMTKERKKMNHTFHVGRGNPVYLTNEFTTEWPQVSVISWQLAYLLGTICVCYQRLLSPDDCSGYIETLFVTERSNQK